MILVAAPLGYQLHLGSGRAIEVRGLIVRPDFEFLNAVNRGRHHPCRGAAARAASRRGSRDQGVHKTARRVAREAGRVCVLCAVHVTGVVAPVQHEGILILVRTGDAAVHCDSRLESYESADVAAKARQGFQRYTSDGVAHSSVHGLQLSICRNYLDGLGGGPDF